MRIENRNIGKVIWRWALGRLSIERKAGKKTHRLPMKVSLLKLSFKYVLGTVIMLETNII